MNYFLSNDTLNTKLWSHNTWSFWAKVFLSQTSMTMKLLHIRFSRGWVTRTGATCEQPQQNMAHSLGSYKCQAQHCTYHHIFIRITHPMCWSGVVRHTCNWKRWHETESHGRDCCGISQHQLSNFCHKNATLRKEHIQYGTEGCAQWLTKSFQCSSRLR